MYGRRLRLDHEEIRRKYDEIAPRFDRLEALIERLGIPLYHEAIKSLVGMDLSPGMLQQARRRAGAATFGVELRVSEAETLPFEDDSFETVTSAMSTCTFIDPVAALREMGRVVRSDGRILLLEHGRSSNPWLARFQDWGAEAHARRLGCRWNQNPRDLVSAAGLRLISGRRVFFGIFHVLEAESRASRFD